MARFKTLFIQAYYLTSRISIRTCIRGRIKAMKYALITFLLTFSVCFAQKPDGISKSSKINLGHLKIPEDAGVSLLPKGIKKQKKVSIFRRPASISIEKDSGSIFSFSANGACTEAGGLTISYDDPRYSDCISQRSFAKKIIFDDPTKSIMMNINIDQFGF